MAADCSMAAEVIGRSRSQIDRLSRNSMFTPFYVLYLARMQGKSFQSLGPTER
jgi:hypothetical protein